MAKIGYARVSTQDQSLDGQIDTLEEYGSERIISEKASGLITLSAVLSLFGLPLEIVALISGVDAIIGMGGTTSNVLWDIIETAVIDKKIKSITICIDIA